MKRRDSILPSSGSRSAKSGEDSRFAGQGLEAFRRHLKAQQGSTPVELPAQEGEEVSGTQDLRSASEQMVQLLLAHGPAPLAIFDENLRLLEASQSWFAVLGLEAQGGHYRALQELMPGKQVSWREELEAVKAGKRSIKQAELVQREDGGYDWVQWSLSPWWRAGEVAGMILSGVVLTEQLEREQGQEPALVLGQSLLEEVQLAVLALNGRGQLRYANEGAMRLLDGRVEDGGVFSQCLDEAQASSWQYALQKSTARWRTQGMALESEQLDLAWYDGRKLRAWQLPWQVQGQVRGVLLLIWPEALEEEGLAENGGEARKAGDGRLAAGELDLSEAQLARSLEREQSQLEQVELEQGQEEMSGEFEEEFAEEEWGLSLVQENVPDLFAAAMAVCTAAGKVLWSNEGWRVLPAETTQAIWPQAGAGAKARNVLPPVGQLGAAQARDFAKDGVEVLMIPLGLGQGKQVEHWLAVARAEAQDRGRAEELLAEREALQGELVQVKESLQAGEVELREMALLLSQEQGGREQAEAQLEESWLELRELRTQAEAREQELAARVQGLEQERFGLKQRLKELVVGHEHFVAKVRKQRSEMEAQLQRAQASAEDAQQDLQEAVGEIGRMREHFDCLNLPVVVLSESGRVESASAAMEDLFCVAPQERQQFLHWLLPRAPDEESESELRFTWEQRLWPERQGEMAALLWDGQGMVREFQLRLQLLPSSVKQGRPRYLLALQDLGDLSQQARSLESFKQRYTSLMSQIPMGVALVAPGRGIVEANERLANWFGCRRRALRGIYLESLVPVESLAMTLRSVLGVCHEPGESVELKLSMRPPRTGVEQARKVTVRLSTALQEAGRAQLQLCLFELPEE